jgi:outer membrane protein TolC
VPDSARIELLRYDTSGNQNSDWSHSVSYAAVSFRDRAGGGPGAGGKPDDDAIRPGERNWLLNLAGNLTAPIFDGGRRAAEVDRTRALTDEKLWAYRQTVLTAVKEVEDALVSESKQKEHIEALERVVSAARKAFDEAVERYRKGLNDYLPVLTQLLSVQSLERNLIKKRASLLLFRVSLYRALGGTWTQDLKSDGLPKH